MFGRMVAFMFVVFWAVCSVCGGSSVSEAGGTKVAADEKTVVIEAAGKGGDRPGRVIQYVYKGDSFKPYVKELYTPGGLNILLDSPSDHIHHHGLMCALAVDGVDFWSETPECGKQMHVSSISTESFSKPSTVGGAFYERLEWVDGEGKVKLREKRMVRVDTKDVDATLVTWRSRFMLPDGAESASIGGSHYFGLGMRFIHAMDGGVFFNADRKESKVFRGEEKLVRSRWCGYHAEVEGKDVTVAMFDNPGNMRYPAMWFMMARPFGYLSATMNLHEEPLEVDAKGVDLCYGIAVWDGKVDSVDVEKMYKKWLVVAAAENK